MKELEAISRKVEEWRELGPVARNGLQCADELESLLSALEAEIAALREPMACTHPRACWREPSSVHPDGHCSMCVEKRLAVAAVLREAAHEVRHTCEQDDSAITSHTEDCRRCRILALIPPADAQTLDAHDCDCPCDICGIGTGFHCCQPPCDIDPYDEIKRILKSVKADVAELDRKHQVEIADLKRQLQQALAQVEIVDRSLGDPGNSSSKAALDAYVDRAVLDFTISALDYFSKKSTTGQQGERGIYSRTYQKFGEFVNSEYPKISANRNKVK